jgi:Fe-S-cluster containining protein
VYVAKDELADLAHARGLAVEQLCAQELFPFTDGYSVMEKESGECLYLGEDGGCAVYAARPRQCRTFPFWRKLLRDPRKWKQYAANCPGMDHGELLTEEEILERMAQSPL